MAAAASTTTASRATKSRPSTPTRKRTSGDGAPLAAAATPTTRKPTQAKPSVQKRTPKQPHKLASRPVAQQGERGLIPPEMSGSNPSRPADSSVVKRHPGGRKSKYTPETVAKIVEALRVGATHDLAQQYAGVGKSAFYQWMQDKPGFEAAVRQAEGEAAVSWLTVIEHAAVKNWQAAAWKLERRYPEMYGRTVQTQEQRGEVHHTLRIVYVDDWRSKQPQLDEPQIVESEKSA